MTSLFCGVILIERLPDVISVMWYLANRRRAVLLGAWRHSNNYFLFIMTSVCLFVLCTLNIISRIQNDWLTPSPSPAPKESPCRYFIYLFIFFTTQNKSAPLTKSSRLVFAANLKPKSVWAGVGRLSCCLTSSKWGEANFLKKKRKKIKGPFRLSLSCGRWSRDRESFFLCALNCFCI